MAQSDPWAIARPGSLYEVPDSWPQDSVPRGRPSRLYVVVAVLDFVASAMHPVWLAIAPSGSFVEPHVYAFPPQDANKGYVLLLFATVGTLVLVRRSRVFGLGLAIALPAIWLAADPGNFRPSLFAGSPDARIATVVFVSFESATVVAAVFAVFALRGLLRREPPAAIIERAQRLRIRLLCLGAGAVLCCGLWLLAGLMSWRVDHYGFADLGDVHTYYCCDFTAQNNFAKAGVLGSFVTAAGFAVAAGFVRSRALSVAWLLGPILFKAAQLPDVGVRAIFPSQSLVGWSVARRSSHLVVSTTLLAGFWFALGGTLIVVIAACLRLRIGRQPANPYSQTQGGV